MSIWSKIFSVGGAGIAAPIDAIGGVIDELHTSREEKDAAKIVLAKLRQEPAKLQTAVNALQAQHRSVFVAGGRPFIIWVCGWALAYMWPIRMLMSDIVFIAGGKPLPAVGLSTADVVALLGPILGLGLLRTGEKVTGKAK